MKRILWATICLVLLAGNAFSQDSSESVKRFEEGQLRGLKSVQLYAHISHDADIDTSKIGLSESEIYDLVETRLKANKIIFSNLKSDQLDLRSIQKLVKADLSKEAGLRVYFTILKGPVGTYVYSMKLELAKSTKVDGLKDTYADAILFSRGLSGFASKDILRNSMKDSLFTYVDQFCSRFVNANAVK